MQRMLMNLALMFGLLLGGQPTALAIDYSFTSIDFPGADYTNALGINDAGQIVGFYASGGHGHGFLFSGGSFTTIDFPGATDTIPRGINNAGQIVGYYAAGGTQHGFLFSGGSFIAIDFPGASLTNLNDINNAGQIVGHYYNPVSHGFLLSGGSFSTVDFPGAQLSLAEGINDNGEIVGQNGNAYPHAFLFSDGSYSVIEFPGANVTNAFGINNVGEIVGTYSGGDEVGHGFLLSAATSITVDFPGAFDTEPRGNNNLGQIVGYYSNADRILHGFLATPGPIANAGSDQSVTEASLTTLDGTASTGQNLTYNWEQVAGPSVTLNGASTATPSFTAPPLPGNFGSQVLTFRLTVTSGGLASSDTVDITVINVNQAPEAHAGADQAVNEGSLVMLDGSASFDPDGDAISYSWVQTSGASVALSGANTANPTFTAPLIAGGVNGSESLGFTLTVADGACFQDEFNRPDSIMVGNDWVDSPNNSGGNLSIRASQLTPGAIGGYEGVYRPFNFDTPISVSATLAESSGFGGLPRQYSAEFTIQSDGTLGTGYRLAFSRSDINFSDSLIQVLDGNTVVARFRPSIQFGPLLDLHFTFEVDGSIVGTVDQNGQSESFLFPAYTIQSAGQYFLLALAGPDGRGTTNPIYHRLDNLMICGNSTSGLATTDHVVVTVEQVNHAPVADAGTPQTVHPGTLVTLDGSASQDPDGDPITYQWTQIGGTAVALTGATTANPSFTAPPVSGTTDLTFRLTVSDSRLTGEAEVVITVKNGPPLCNLARAVPSVLWPPNHKMLSVGIVGVSDPDDALLTIAVQSVTQDELVNGLGDGDTSPDAVIQGGSALLRAERSGGGNGRVYRIAFSADDGNGGTCTGAVNVGVPHSMKPGMDAVDDGQLYDSTQP